MKLIYTVILAMLWAQMVSAQLNRYILLQSTDGSSFYAKVNNGKPLASSYSGHLIIPKQQGKVNLTIGFPKKEGEFLYEINVANKDLGFIIKNLGDKGWCLYNWQTTDIVYIKNMQPATNTNIASEKQNVEKENAESYKEPLKKENVATPTEPSAKIEDTKQPTAGDNDLMKQLQQKAADPVKPIKTTEVITPTIVKETEIIAPPPSIKKELLPTPGINFLKAIDDVEFVLSFYEVVHEDLSIDTITVKVSKKEITMPVPPVVTIDTVKKESFKIDTLQTLPTPINDTLTLISRDTANKNNSISQKVAEDNNIGIIAQDTSMASTAPKITIATAKALSDSIKIAPVYKAPTDTMLVMPNSNCTNFATEDDMKQLRKKMLDENDEESKVDVARKAFRKKCYSTALIKKLVAVIDTEKGKYDLLDAVYPFTADSEAFKSLGSLLTDDYYKQRFTAMIR
jgi:hypothetical protein